MTKREWHMKLALSSVRQLRELLDDLTPEELTACLQLEYETRRRKHIIDTLIAKLAELNRQHFITQLKEKLNGSRLCNSK